MADRTGSGSHLLLRATARASAIGVSRLLPAYLTHQPTSLHGHHGSSKSPCFFFWWWWFEKKKNIRDRHVKILEALQLLRKCKHKLKWDEILMQVTTDFETPFFLVNEKHWCLPATISRDYVSGHGPCKENWVICGHQTHPPSLSGTFLFVMGIILFSHLREDHLFVDHDHSHADMDLHAPWDISRAWKASSKIWHNAQSSWEHIESKTLGMW